MKQFHKYFSLLLSLLFVGILFIDLGNVDALRQGTEGFYLQLAKETYLEKSWLTPIHTGVPHWSKPPLQLWLTFPFYAIAGEPNLFASRLSILLFSLLFAYLIDRWCNRHLNSKPLYFFIFFCGSFGFIKFARIFMMEMPLSLLTCYASLKLYDYFESNNKSDLVSSSLILGASNLVKGPVSFAMGFGGAGLFTTYQLLFKQKSFKFRDLALWGFLSVSVGSIWYFISYFNHGDDFFRYFFLRENIGKFTSKSYPIRVVFQGLIIFSLPWILFFPFSIKKGWRTNSRNKAVRFVFWNFLFFFSLWLIPSQRSHHYAMPSIPLFLILIFQTCFNNGEFYKSSKVPHRLMAFFFILLGFLVALSLRFPEIINDGEKLIRIISTFLVISIAIFISLTRTRFIKQVLIINYFALTFVWIIFAPCFYLPVIPEQVFEATRKHEVTVLFRKPFFIAEALEKEINIVSEVEILNQLNPPEGLFVVEERWYSQLNLENKLEIRQKWPIWKRGAKAKEIVKAISKGNLYQLQESLLLLGPRQLRRLD